jgi:hypothetical protein
MKKHKILDKKRLLNTTTGSVALLIAAILISSGAISAAVPNANLGTMNEMVESQEVRDVREPEKIKQTGDALISPNLNPRNTNLPSTAGLLKPLKGNQEPLDYWELWLEVDTSPASIYLVGSVCDGENIYIGSFNGPTFYRFDLEGEYVDSFTISGISSATDMDYDDDNDRAFVTGLTAVNVYMVDFANEEVLETISHSCGSPYAMGYNEDEEVMYLSSWGDPVYIVDLDGETVDQFDLSLTTSTLGLAYDRWSDEQPLLWVFDQGGTGAEIRAWSLDDGEFLPE